MAQIDDDDDYKYSEWDSFFDELETWIKAVITDHTSDHVEDSVHKTELRDNFIAHLMDRRFNIP